MHTPRIVVAAMLMVVLNKRDGIIRLLVRSSLPAVSPGETHATHK